MLLAAEQDGGLYYFKGASSTKDNKAYETWNITNADFEKNSLQVWHVRMGPFNMKGINADAIMDFECHACLQGKMGRTPLPKFSERATTSGDITHSDLFGPMRVAFHRKKIAIHYVY